MMILFFFVLGLIYEATKLVFRIAGKLAGILFGLALCCAALSLAAGMIGLVWRILPGALFILIVLSALQLA
jgi:hypothetical protein